MGPTIQFIELENCGGKVKEGKIVLLTEEAGRVISFLFPLHRTGGAISQITSNFNHRQVF